MGNKHRANNRKLKYEHHMIRHLRPWLESLEPWDEIQSMIPGRIAHKGGTDSQFWVRIQYAQQTGLKLKAHSKGGVQEVFMTTRSPDRLAERLRGEKGVRG